MTLPRHALLAVTLFAVCLGARAEERPKDGPHLRFLVVANDRDDRTPVEIAARVLTVAAKEEKAKAQLKKCAVDGVPPPPIVVVFGEKKQKYSWIEIGPMELRALHLDEPPQEKDSPAAARWAAIAAARERGEAITLPDSRWLLFSRPCEEERLSPEERARKHFDYFLLIRDPDSGVVTGADLEEVKRGQSAVPGMSLISLRLSAEGGDRFFALTGALKPEGPGRFRRHLAVVVDNRIVAAPAVQDAVRRDVQITGQFSAEELNALIRALESDLKKKK
jgi:hypothetical protein